MSYPVVIVDYDLRWPRMFAEERARILAAIGSRDVTVEHVGSTAVPGLVAKPIIDILVGVRRLDEATACIPPLEHIGYEYIPEREIERPERRFLAKPTTKPRTHHIHMVEAGSAFWDRHLLFRDYMRTHGEAADAYARLKRELVVKFREDRDAYTEGKTVFIRDIEERARRG